MKFTKYLKEAKQIILTDRVKVEAWLASRGIQQYEISNEGKVTVRGNVIILLSEGEQLEVQFDKIYGNFKIRGKKLTSLKGCPWYVGGDFACKVFLGSLKGGPIDVRGDYKCEFCNLKTLEGIAPHIVGDLNCADNKLKTLEYFPVRIGGSIKLNKNKLVSLKGCPKDVRGDFLCDDNNEIISLADGPSNIHNSFSFLNTGITSLVGINDILTNVSGDIWLSGEKIISGGLGLMLIKGVAGLSTVPENSGAFKIISKYIRQPDRIFECQEELIEAGFETYAQL